MEAILLRITEDALKGNQKSATFVLNRYAAMVSGELQRPDLGDEDREVLEAFARPDQPPSHERRGAIMSRTDQDFLNAALRSDLLAFLHRSVLTLNPGSPFLANWHLEAIAYQLERIRRGEINRLIINLPPRSLKSIMVSVALPAFLLGHDPRLKIFGISYGSDLAAKHAADFRSIVQVALVPPRIPNMQIARMADSDVYTTSRGYRRTTSVNATLTGLGGDGFIIDDPLKPVDAQSDALRSTLNEWFSNTLVSRLDNKETGFIIVVMQRVHLNDLTGHLLERSASTGRF